MSLFFGDRGCFQASATASIRFKFLVQITQNDTARATYLILLALSLNHGALFVWLLKSGRPSHRENNQIMYRKFAFSITSLVYREWCETCRNIFFISRQNCRILQAKQEIWHVLWIDLEGTCPSRGTRPGGLVAPLAANSAVALEVDTLQQHKQSKIASKASLISRPCALKTIANGSTTAFFVFSPQSARSIPFAVLTVTSSPSGRGVLFESLFSFKGHIPSQKFL